MKIFLEPDDLDVRIELIPLIDVIFCILVFFILGAVSYGRAQGLNLDLPKAETAQTQLSDTLKVEVDSLSQIKVDNTPVTEEQLVQVMAGYIRKNPQGVVVLEADRLVNYGTVAQLIDKLQQIGGNRVALGAVRPDPNAASPSPFPGSLQPPTSPLNPGLSSPQTLPQPSLPGTVTVPQTIPQTIPQTTSPVLPSGAGKTAPQSSGQLTQPSALPSTQTSVQTASPSPKAR